MMTITEGLVALKTLDARIEKEISQTTFSLANQKGKPIAGYENVDAFIAKAKAQYQSILDLIARRNKIKSAIVESNAITKVTIDGVVYSVAGAIERKASIKYDQMLASTMFQQFQRASRVVEVATGEAQQRLDNLLLSTFGKDAKVDASQIQSVSDGFWKQNETILRDPLNTVATVETINRNVQSFLANVDVALSISNATTFIDV